MAKEKFSEEEAEKIGEELGIDWQDFNVDQFRRGLDVELEHGLVSSETNVSNDDPLITGKIARLIFASFLIITTDWKRWRKKPRNIGRKKIKIKKLHIYKF